MYESILIWKFCVKEIMAQDVGFIGKPLQREVWSFHGQASPLTAEDASTLQFLSLPEGIYGIEREVIKKKA